MFKQLMDKFDDYSVSTVFAVDIETYETVVVYPDENSLVGAKYILAQRYKTKEEAIKGHQEVIDNLLAGKKYDGKDEIFDKIIEEKDLPKMLECVEKTITGSLIKHMLKKEK